MTTYKLTYFDFDGGRGEPVRIAFHAAGIPFEDERWSFPEFQEKRDSLRFGALPVLEIDGVVVTQSNAHCRYLGRKSGLYPKDELQALYCDEAMGAAEDLTHHIARTMGLEGDELKKARDALVAGRLPTFLRGLSEMLVRGGGKYFADKRLTVADLKVYYTVRWVGSGSLDHVPADLIEKVAPKLAAHAAQIAGEPVVKAYYESRA